MKNFKIRRVITFIFVERPGLRLADVRLVAALALSFAAASIVPIPSQAQRLYAPVKVSNVSAQGSGSGTVVSVVANGSLSRAQSWQDNEGYHVVIPNTLPVDSLKTGRGVKVRRVGTSLEILLQTKPGAKVSVQSGDNRLNLVLDGKLEEKAVDLDLPGPSTSAEERRLFEDPKYQGLGRQENAPLRLSSPVEDLSTNSRPSGTENSQWPTSSSPNRLTPSAPPVITTNQIIPQGNAPAANPTASEIKIQPEDEGFLASVFSGTSVFIVMALGLFGLLVSRKLRSRQALAQTVETSFSEEGEWVDNQISEGTSLQVRSAQTGESVRSLARAGESASASGSSRQSLVRMPVSGPTSLYGAYRIDQEVGKLVFGQPHRIDVLASRAVDDRRAIETSLIKGVNSADLDEDARRRAREALEEYGFVARQCASLLLAPDSFERTSAARALGEIKSPAALPFLLEGLYDSESIVRNQAVVSIGELKLPSAIGALLDIARTHPDVPSALLSRTLSACSVEGLDFFDAVIPEPAQLGTGHRANTVEEITHLEPASSVEELPEGSDDEGLAHALSSLGSSDVEQRIEALKILAQFRVQSSVAAIASVARRESEPSVRSVAISSLGSINHESVFPFILIGMSDDSREVRAAAARSLNRLSFDRAGAYVRVIQTGDEEMICNVAKACIQAGIVSQNLDRLASSDHRQAYETFSLICLLAKAKMNEPVLDAIADHPTLDVRLGAIHLLACTGEPEIFEQLRQLAVKDGVGEEVKTVLLEAMYKLDQAKLRKEETLEAFMAIEPGSEGPEAESQLEPEFETQFEPAFESHFEPEFGSDAQPNMDELEL